MVSIRREVCQVGERTRNRTLKGESSVSIKEDIASKLVRHLSCLKLRSSVDFPKDIEYEKGWNAAVDLC